MATDSTGATVGTQTYKPFGEIRASTGSFGTEKKFTGQRLDGTGLCFYNERYYDSALGRKVGMRLLPDGQFPGPGGKRYLRVSRLTILIVTTIIAVITMAATLTLVYLVLDCPIGVIIVTAIFSTIPIGLGIYTGNRTLKSEYYEPKKK